MHRSVPDYFHKVVDCQWACPAHTPVPEYIRLIAAGRYSDAYMINWESNVFPGILGRICDRPCEPACRRGRLDFISGRAPIKVNYAAGSVELVELHDGSTLALRKLDADYDVHDRLGAMTFQQLHAAKGQIVTGLLYVALEAEDLHGHLNTVEAPLNALGENDLCPGAAALEKFNASLR
jgi:hypothetical protein